MATEVDEYVPGVPPKMPELNFEMGDQEIAESVYDDAARMFKRWLDRYPECLEKSDLMSSLMHSAAKRGERGLFLVAFHCRRGRARGMMGYPWQRPVDWLLGNGYLDLAKQLIDQGERATTNAYELAAANGQLEAIKWLHETCRVPCTPAALEAAIISNHPEVVKYLEDNVPASHIPLETKKKLCDLQRYLQTLP